MMQGTITGLRTGFGFIKTEGAAKDTFFHATSLIAPLTFDELKVGDVLTFEIEEGDKGPKAVRVSRA